MKVRIEVVTSTDGNDAEYLGRHFGNAVIGKPLNRQVVTFEVDLTESELLRLKEASQREISNMLMNQHALKLVSWSFRHIVSHE